MDRLATDYRHAPPRCPGCRSSMNLQSVDSASLDVCPSCSGVWVNWFDGEVRSLLRNLTPLAETPQQPVECPGCPTCGVPLLQENVAGLEVYIFRCPTCQGTFVPARAREELAELPPGSLRGEGNSGLDQLLVWLQEKLWQE